MPVYKVKCTACGFRDNQYLTQDFNSKIIPCPNCMRGALAVKIKTKGVVEAEADGVVGYLKDDNQRNNNSQHSQE